MNDIAKTSTKTKLISAMEREQLRPAEVARVLGIRDNYVSMMRNEKQWDHCPASAWDATLRWINSGQTLTEFGEKHGKVVPEIPQKHELPPKVVKVEKPEQKMKQEDVGVKKIVIERSDKGIKIDGAKLSGNIWANNDSEREFKISPPEQHQKVSIDIEINLIINGKKITI